MLRRRTTARPPATTPPQEPKATGKGRPTPKRREVEAQRRRPIGATPADRKAARADARARRMELRAAMERGDESRLPPRDRGPVRRYARDYVDSRRTISEFFLPLGILFYLPLIFAGRTALAGYASITLMLLLVVLVFELFRLGFGLSRALTRQFPDTDRRGAVFYGITRAGQMRRFRMPKPKVAVGERPDRPAAGRG